LFDSLCVIGLAPTHIAFKDEGGITSVDFNVGKSDRSVLKVSGKRKKNALRSESNTALCKVSTAKDTYIVRCCVKGSLLEVNERLIKQPELLNSTVSNKRGKLASLTNPQKPMKISFFAMSLYCCCTFNNNLSSYVILLMSRTLLMESVG
jgi:glycine cleavage system H lipoate-binding protein